jgi:peptidyl-prolyl cis-trans isomerase B (cyclophilin B)
MTNPVIKINVRDFGTMTAELYPDKAPKTVANFLKLAESGFFEGLIFHRVIKGFMIQGGGYTEDMGDTDTPSIKGEFKANGVKNDLSHKRGVISMARTQIPNSASSQFFICHADATFLDGQYAAFGAVVDGIEGVDHIASSKTDFRDKPYEDQVMKAVYFVEKD